MRDSVDSVEARFDVDGRHLITSWSNEAAELWGWTRDEILGTPLARLVPPRNRARQEHFLNALLDSSDSRVTREIPALHRDGREFRVSLMVVVALGESQPHFTLSVQGINPTKWAAWSFQANDERHRSILDQINDGCAVTDLSGNFLFINAAYRRMFSLPDNAVGTNFRQYFPPEAIATLHSVHSQAFRTGQPVQGFEFFIKEGEEQIWIEMSVSLERDQNGEAIGFNGITRDCTRRVCAEREVALAKVAAEEAKKAADHANRAKSEFLANMSHEIRTPMNGVIGMIDLALSTSLDSVQRDYVETARASAESLLHLIDDILDFSKIESGRLEIDSVDFSLRRMLDEAAKPLAFGADQKRLDLVIDIDPDVPDHLNGDPHRLRQIVVNLAGNAIKFTNEGEVVIRVGSKPCPGGVQLRVSVIDTGIGIPVDKQSRIFEAFSQAEASTTRRYGGTGLGLSISTQLVKLMGGEIWVESTPGLGSVFQFQVTLGFATDVLSPAIPALSHALHGLTAMVVEDNATALRVISTMLMQAGMQVVAASGADEARAEIQKSGQAFRIAIIDMNLPEMRGTDLARELRRHPRCASAAVLVLSSSANLHEARDASALDNARYLAKPVGRTALLEAVQTLLRSQPTDAAKPHAPDVLPMRAARRLRLLIAEDNVVNRKVIEHLVRRHGHEPVLVTNGREAVEAVAGNRFDLVLMDVQMPEMDGFEATAAIRAKETRRGERLPIVALTACAMEGDRQGCIDAGMDGYVSKPVHPTELFEVIDRVMRQPRTHYLPSQRPRPRRSP